MGFSGDIMHSIVEKELKRNYPVSEGWVSQPGSKKIGSGEIFTLTKKRGGKNEVAFVGITFEKAVSSELIDDLISSSKYPAGSRTVSHTALIVPQGTDTKNVHSSVRVTWMRAFRYKDSDLVWLKHPTHKAAGRNSS